MKAAEKEDSEWHKRYGWYKCTLFCVVRLC